MSDRAPRFRTDFKEVTVLANSLTNGVLQQSDPFNRWLYYHWMADQINPINRSTGKRPPGFCQHLKLDKTYIASTFSNWRVDSGTVYTNTNPDWLSSFSRAAGQSPTGSATDSLDIGYQAALGEDFTHTARFADLCFEAWTKLKTEVPLDVSVINFAYELLDFKDLAKRVLHPKQGVAALKKYAATSNWSKVKRLPKSINGEFLDVSFNWLPLIGDVQKIMDLHDSSARRLDFLRKTRGKEVTIHFDKTDCYINSLVGVEQLLAFQNDDWKKPFRLNKYQCDFHVTAKLYQDLEGLDDAWAQLRVGIAAAGINNPAKIVWNAIPFSFVADWVAPFGKWLDRAALQPFNGVWKVYDITTSVRERGEVEVYVVPKPGRNLQFNQTTVTKVDVDKYLRMVGLPQTLGAIDFSQLTSQQQKLFLSLVLTKVL